MSNNESNDDMSGSVNNPEREVSAVAANVKMPEFKPNNPRLWFMLCETQFTIKKVKNEQEKWAHTIGALPHEITDKIYPFLQSSTDHQYTDLKDYMITEFQPSESEAAALLLDLPGLGDQKPSHLLAHMFTLLPPEEHANPSILVKELFLRKLPTDIRAHLMDKSTLSLKDLAKEADKFYGVTGHRLNVSSISTASANQDNPEPLLSTAEIAALRITNAPQHSFPRPNRNQPRYDRQQQPRPYNNQSRSYDTRPRRDNQHNRAASRPPPPRQQPSNWCDNHINYRENTRTCKNPYTCTYPN